MTSNTADLLLPAGIYLFVSEDGDGFRNLGNITGSNIEQAIEKLEHYSSQSGSRKLDLTTVTKSTIGIKFNLEEASARNLAYFFHGSAPTRAVASEVAVTGEIVILPATVTAPLALPLATVAPITAVRGLDGTAYRLDPVSYAVTAVSTGAKKFTVAGDHAADFPTGYHLTVAGSTANDSTYTVVSATLVGGNTEVVVSEAVPSSVADGDLVRGGDYTVDAVNNGIRRTAGSTIPVGTEVLVDYQWAAPARSSFPVLASPIRACAARFLMIPQQGNKVMWTIRKAQLSAAGALSLDDTKFAEMPMQLDVLADASTPSAPYGTLTQWA